MDAPSGHQVSAYSASSAKFALWLVALLTLSIAAPRFANANTITVDEAGEPFLFFGKCSIRRAIENHNAKGQPNKQCASGNGNDTIDMPLNATVSNPLPTIEGTLTIDPGHGRGLQCTNIEGAAYLKVASGANLTLWGIGVTVNGSHSLSVIENSGTLTIKPWAGESCRYSNERRGSRAFSGGILTNRPGATTTISGGANFVNSNLSGDGPLNEGGAIDIQGGIVNITDQTAELPIRFTDDIATNGGAIFVAPNARLNIASNNFTFLNNDAISGGAIYNSGGIVTIGPGTNRPPKVDRSIAFNGASNGGAIYNRSGQLTVDGIQIFNNSSHGNGGAIFVTDNLNNQRPTTITRTYFHDNSASGNGAVAYLASNAIVNASGNTFTNDRALQRGAIYVDSGSQLKVVNSTFLGGSPNPEGITVGSGGAEVVFSTIAASNLLGSASSIRLSNSLLQSVSCNQAVVDDGLNLQHGSALCPASIPDLNPALVLTLANNGGLTPTIALAAGSNAIDAIPVGDCIDQEGNKVTIDQRGFGRPAGPACDIGAFEFGAVPAL